MNRATALFLFAFLPITLRAADGPTFDVASVKIAAPETPPNMTGGPATEDPGRFHATHMSMSMMLFRAFGVPPDQIQISKRLNELPMKFYNIDATMPPTTTMEQFQKMFQNLLMVRFHLVYHRETRNFVGYELVVDTGGPKIKEVHPDSKPLGPTVRQPRGQDGFPVVSGPLTMTLSDSGTSRTKCQERSMAEFVSTLGRMIGLSQGRIPGPGALQPRVVDKTGLTGKYTFVLEYYDPSRAELRDRIERDMAYTGPRTDASRNSEAAGDSSGAPDIFTAVKKQLGLRLDKTRSIPLDVFIVESLDIIPVGN
jgi:uncharacterized protein (TIGR03435 family)